MNYMEYKIQIISKFQIVQVPIKKNHQYNQQNKKIKAKRKNKARNQLIYKHQIKKKIMKNNIYYNNQSYQFQL